MSRHDPIAEHLVFLVAAALGLFVGLAWFRIARTPLPLAVGSVVLYLVGLGLLLAARRPAPRRDRPAADPLANLRPQLRRLGYEVMGVILVFTLLFLSSPAHR